MRIQVRYFAVLRERLSMEREALVLPEGATVGEAIVALAARHDAIARLAGRFQSAVNRQMVPSETRLSDGDELALIPPVAGGADAARHARMVEDTPSLDRVSRAVVGPDVGGLVTFTGLVRRQSQGRVVEHLEYEAYVEMADQVMARLCDDVEHETGARIAVEHASGKLVVGEIAVVIAAAAPHRAEAFAACRALIDRLKEEVPIWKLEVGPDGTNWIGLGP